MAVTIAAEMSEPINNETAAAAEAVTEERDELRRLCRPLSGSRPEPEHGELERVAAWCQSNDIKADSYGQGPDLAAFEDRVADLLGCPAARFMPSGTMAQQIAVRVWSEQSGRRLIGMHPTCHLELHEEEGYARLHGLHRVLVGEAGRPMRPANLDAVPEPMAALIVELPTRENGGQLASWDDLVALSTEARRRHIHPHLDGARLWEAAAGYERPLDEVAGLFDSVYVSFYKGIGALPGAVLAGPTDVISQATIWQRRSGGNLYTSMANWASAAMRLDDQLAKMTAYRDRARELAGVLCRLDGLTVNPERPQVNMFHVFLTSDRAALLAARDQTARDHRLWLHGGLQATDVPGIHRFEVTIGDSAMDIDPGDLAVAFEHLPDRRLNRRAPTTTAHRYDCVHGSVNRQHHHVLLRPPGHRRLRHRRGRADLRSDR